MAQHQIKVHLGDSGRLPHREHEGDAGFDIYVAKRTIVAPASFCLVPSGIRVQMPSDTWYLILGRSSASNKRGLIVIPAVIDAGFRGLLYANVYNPNVHGVVVEEGDRLAQMVPMALMAHLMEPVSVPRLDDTDRGERGFGSSGH